MIPHLFYADPEAFRTAMDARGFPAESVDSLRRGYQLHQEAVTAAHALRAQFEEETAHGRGRRSPARLRSLTRQIEAAERHALLAGQAFSQAAHSVPNLPHPDAPRGGRANYRLIRCRGAERPAGPVLEAAHVATLRGLWDPGRATEQAGPGFALFKGAGATLLRALTSFLLQVARTANYVEVEPPYVFDWAAAARGAVLPWNRNLFTTEGAGIPRRYLLPDGSAALLHLHAGETLTGQLPRRYVAAVPQFAQANDPPGGFFGLQQSPAVSLTWFLPPDRGSAPSDALVGFLEACVALLELPYRVVEYATGVLPPRAERAYGVEVRMPARGEFRPAATSEANGDFVALRGGVRWQDPADSAKTLPAHTLNGSFSVVALFAAVLENYQQPDGSVRVPAVLLPYMDGVAHIGQSEAVP